VFCHFKFTTYQNLHQTFFFLNEEAPIILYLLSIFRVTFCQSCKLITMDFFSHDGELSTSNFVFCFERLSLKDGYNSLVQSSNTKKRERERESRAEDHKIEPLPCPLLIQTIMSIEA
jgi:hypothetical protein